MIEEHKNQTHECCDADGNALRKQKRKLIAGVAAAALLFGAVAAARWSAWGTAAVWSLSGGGKLLFPLVVISAMIDSIHPCAFSILLLTIAFLFSIGRVRSGIMKIGLVYVFGIFLVYLLIGLGILQVLHLFNTPHFMGKLGATLLILFGVLNIINQFFPRFPVKLHIPAAAHRNMAKLMEYASLPTAFLLGGLVGLCSFPCVGGPYLMVLGLLRDQLTYLKGLLYLVVYNIIFVLPLIIVLAIASNRVLLRRVHIWQKKGRGQMRFWSGIAMIILGLLIFFL